MENARWLVVCNPRAGRGKSADRAKRIVELLRIQGQDSQLIEEDSKRSSQEKFGSLIAGETFRGIFVVGGDGLISDIALILHQLNSRIPFVAIPAGTGNDFARTCRTFGRKLDEIVLHVITQAPTPIDAILVNGVPVLEIVSTGLDAQVNQRANRMSSFLGKAKYVFAMLAVLRKYSPVHYRVTLDGDIVESPAMFIAIANAPSYGGGMLISPHSNVNDGILEIAILKPVRKLELLRVFPRVFAGSHLSHPAFEVLQGKRGRLEAETMAFGDGEALGNLPIDFEVTPDCFSVWKL